MKGLMQLVNRAMTKVQKQIGVWKKSRSEKLVGRSLDRNRSFNINDQTKTRVTAWACSKGRCPGDRGHLHRRRHCARGSDWEERGGTEPAPQLGADTLKSWSSKRIITNQSLKPKRCFGNDENDDSIVRLYPLKVHLNLSLPPGWVHNRWPLAKAESDGSRTPLMRHNTAPN